MHLVWILISPIYYIENSRLFKSAYSKFLYDHNFKTPKIRSDFASKSQSDIDIKKSWRCTINASSISKLQVHIFTFKFSTIAAKVVF